MLPALRPRGIVLGAAMAVFLTAGLVVDASGTPAVAATTFVVNTTGDSFDASLGDGICADAAGACSLRAAVMEAGAGPGPNAISIPPGLYRFSLANPLTVASGELSITGSGPEATIIDAHQLAGVISVLAAAEVTLVGVTLTGGRDGGVFNSGSMTIRDSRITANSAADWGGGIENNIGTMTIVNSEISENTGWTGGGIFNNGTLTIRGSTIKWNRVWSSEVATRGGGIANAFVLTVTNSTISGNHSGDLGGGIWNGESGELRLVSSTVARNVVDAPGGGGGIHNEFATMELTASLIADNRNATGTSDCVSNRAPTSGGYNLIGDGTGCNWPADPTDLIGTAANPQDPRLRPLMDNGGPVETHGVLAGSPAIDAIPSASCVVSTDARGVPRPQGVGCDIGALEATPRDANPTDTVGLVDPSTGRWYLRDSEGTWEASPHYGNPGDIPFMGDWDCDGVDTFGLFRQSDAYAYLRNSNTRGFADIRFFFGNPSDVPLAGDFNGDGCDTLSIYRPSEQRFYIVNELGEDDGGLGVADYSFLFGNPGDKPVVGDWDGDGIDEVGLHRESTGFFYWRNTLNTGVADGEIFFGDPGDRFIAGDWGGQVGYETPAVFRPSDRTFYFRHTLTQGVADSQFDMTLADSSWLPVGGQLGLR